MKNIAIIVLSVGSALIGAQYSLVTSQRQTEEPSLVSFTVGFGAFDHDWECIDDPRQQWDNKQWCSTLSVNLRHKHCGIVVAAQVTSGRTMHVVCHSPLECFPANGYVLTSPVHRQMMESGTATDELWTASFARSKRVAEEKTLVCWAWSVGQTWEAPEHPRLAYASCKQLHKICLVCQADANITEPCYPCLSAFRSLRHWLRLTKVSPDSALSS